MFVLRPRTTNDRNIALGQSLAGRCYELASYQAPTEPNGALDDLPAAFSPEMKGNWTERRQVDS
jgi:hypothetical protein